MSTIDDDDTAGEGVMSRLDELWAMLAYLPPALRLVWTAASAWTTAWLVLLLVQGVLPAASVYLTKWVLDAAEVAVGGGLAWDNVRILLVPAGLMAAVIVAQRSLGSVTAWIQTAQGELVQDHLQSLVHAKAVDVDMIYYESAEYYDLLEEATGNASSKPIELLNSAGGVLQNGTTVVSIAGLLIPYGWWVPLVLILSTLPALFVVVRYKREHHDWWSRTTPQRRKCGYYDLFLTSRRTAPEMRLFGVGDLFQEAYQALRSQLRNERIDLRRRRAIATVLASLSALIITAAVMGWMVWRALLGAATLGDLGLFYRSFNRGQGLMQDLLGSVGTIYSSSYFLEHLFRFLDVEPTIRAPEDPAPVPSVLEEGIRFENVTFRYPGTQRAALKDFSLHIPAGTTVALVGPNGAGKSTLIKLLCRFFDPDAGCITIDGVDLRRFDPDTLRQHFAVLFQDPVRYQTPAADNIAYGDVTRSRDREAVIAAARKGLADTFLETFEEGYDTQLGRWFADGRELSGGQWKRVCLARAFYRDAPVVILDEPTSTMDSWAENRWLEQFGELVEDRTGLVVTHRFTTAMHADRIHVMRDHEIIESGSHEELLEREGFYASSWRSQVEHGWRGLDEDGTDDQKRPDAPVRDGQPGTRDR
jgi:ATP-binding cassette subfamily B protein